MAISTNTLQHSDHILYSKPASVTHKITCRLTACKHYWITCLLQSGTKKSGPPCSLWT